MAGAGSDRDQQYHHDQQEFLLANSLSYPNVSFISQLKEYLKISKVEDLKNSIFVDVFSFRKLTPSQDIGISESANLPLKRSVDPLRQVTTGEFKPQIMVL